ncbi:hypothetical protein [Nakamurella sp.]|uniref:hypothetical protein n=1 Tax=Nakamurella sp. TaxID=1869182 RepID=UPI003B3B6FCA
MPRTLGTPTSVTGRVVAILDVFTDEPDALPLVTISERCGDRCPPPVGWSPNSSLGGS